MSKKTFIETLCGNMDRVITFVSTDYAGFNGRAFKLFYNDWNGEKYFDCWEVNPENHRERIGEDSYTFIPVYDWDNFDEDAQEFRDGSDGIIDWEIA